MKKWLEHTWQTYKITNQIPYIISIWAPFHILAIVGLVELVNNFLLDYILYFLLGWTIFGGLGTAIMLHRYFSHRSIIIRPILKPILYWISCMSAQGSPIWWAALHRGYHHAHSDKEKDIHSPTKGFWHAYMGWMFSVKHDSVNLKYSTELLRDKMLIWFHKHYNVIVWSSVAALMLIDPMLCIWFYIIPTLVGLHTDSMVNSLCHTKSAGYRLHETKDHSVNVWYLGIFGWGQGWHNNHHAYPKSFDFGRSISKVWYEFDPCLLWVPIISPWPETVKLWNKWRNA